MGKIVLAFAAAVLFKWAWEILGWLKKANPKGTPAANRKGYKDWWMECRFDLARKGIGDIILCVLWSMGVLVAPLNAALSSIGVDPIATELTWQSSAAAGWILDSLGKPILERVAALGGDA